MATRGSTTAPAILIVLGDFRWVRAHISLFSVGAVILVCANLLIGGGRLWSLTAIGIWSMLLIVHLVVLAIARLSVQLLTDDDEEVVLLPIRDAVIVDPKPDPAATWTEAEPPEPGEEQSTTSSDTVSWQLATDRAQAKPEDTKETDST